MWPDLIRKAKEGGLDVIQTYVFWNGHEPSPGKVRKILFLIGHQLDLFVVCVNKVLIHWIPLLCYFGFICSIISRATMIWLSLSSWSNNQDSILI